MTQIRYIEIGGVTGVELVAEHEITKNTEPLSPMILSYWLNKPTFVLGGYYSPSKYLIPENIKPEADLVRMYCPPNSNAGCMYLDQNILQLSIHIKIADLQGKNLENVSNVLCMDACIEVLAEFGIDVKKATSKELNNDMVILEDGREKKVAGFWVNPTYREGWITFAFMVSFKLNYELPARVFRLDTEKMVEKNITKVEDAISDVDKEGKLDKSIVARKIANNISGKLGLALIDGQFTPEEQTAMDNVKEVIASDEWINDAKRPIENLNESPHEFPIEDL